MAQPYDSATRHGPQDIEGLPSSVNVYHYNSMDDFCRVISLERSRLYSSLRAAQGNYEGRQDNLPQTEGTHSGHIIFIIQPSIFAHDFLDPSADLPFHDRISFNPKTNFLIVKILYPTHELTARAFENMLNSMLQERGLQNTIFPWGSTTLTDEDDTCKEPDGGWGPRRPPRGAPKRPSVVLEVASSETPGKLRRDCHYWVDSARGQANMAFGVKVHVNIPEITIEQWEWNSEVSRPIRKQYLTITKSRSDGKVGFDPEQPAPQLLIPFHLLFRRPAENHRERDIVFMTQDLVEFGTLVWDMQDLQFENESE
ncbi:hypothetical protein N7447_006168 [Penicillium robsamsonii]|uniref:uncharacterized protein n=1 Tax=Penicillium robsamsonii TaxID=1792511 RepID=UPI00254746F8|nr:uncharacterized protein N7447_006168 [Penicillium robsamsonii]KAJ5823828.1 hypothetical protein N7447_006168 [Penicillium robsamsonii]